MRLIDLSTIEKWIDENLQPQPATFIKKCTLAVEQEKGTVEAIPIEWIEKYIKEAPTHYLFVGDMLEDWRKENEPEATIL